MNSRLSDYLWIERVFRTQSVNFVGILWKGGASLIGLVLQALRPSSPYCHADLSQRRITCGSVENAGNTCILSVILQEYAALPEAYHAFLKTPLIQRQDEGEHAFIKRKRLQELLADSVDAIQSGKTVIKKDVLQITYLLVQLGWLKDADPLWRLKLYEWAPNLFPLPISDPYALYDTLLALYPEGASNYKIALLANTAHVAHRHLLELSPFMDVQEEMLWRVAEDRTIDVDLEESFQVDRRLFSLKLVHVFENTPQGAHVVIYRKLKEEWICCNDAKVSCVKTLPIKNIYTVI
jgi:hypothetical protein